MRRLSKGLLLALGLLAAAVAPAWARPGSYGATSLPPPPDAPRFVEFSSIEGLPRDPAASALVTDAMRLVFGDSELDVEGPLAPADPIVHRFRLLESPPEDTVWTVQVVLGFPRELPKPESGSAHTRKRAVRGAAEPGMPARPKGSRLTNGLIVAVAALSAEARFQGARPIPIRTEVLLPADSTGAYPWSDAGRAAGRLAIESLLRAAGDLRTEQRVALAPAVRSATKAP